MDATSEGDLDVLHARSQDSDPGDTHYSMTLKNKPLKHDGTRRPARIPERPSLTARGLGNRALEHSRYHGLTAGSGRPLCPSTKPIRLGEGLLSPVIRVPQRTRR